ncbi:leucine-rich PPR motif-containing protein, mitochondrial [Caerostris extrusa]|uniref:Leucine-rich PPR motif-containing protein, mitochondrial n=1 Tax=Caerostris extrusa TaxID=172846 RepID=A0AAV4RC30_CAEEX|nr:leucine-rich PPR motif-containing protein, mitochondrial [Caerostris extrusa]
MESIENAFTELDNYIQRKGRCNKFAVEEILSTIKHFHFATGNHGLYLLRSCGLMYTEKPDERVKFANTIWKKLNEIGVPLDVRHFNSLLKIFVDCNHKFLPSEFLVLMENSKIEPNNVTYLHLLQKYCNYGNLNGASEVLQCLKEKELPINELVFNTLITGHMRANDTSGAKDILEVMRKANLSPTPATYTAIACGYAEKGEIEDVKSILNEAKSNNIVLSNTNYLSIITSLSSDENPDFVDELLKMMPNLYEWKQEVTNAMIILINKNMDNYAFKLLLAIATQKAIFQIYL